MKHLIHIIKFLRLIWKPQVCVLELNFRAVALQEFSFAPLLLYDF